MNKYFLLFFILFCFSCASLPSGFTCTQSIIDKNVYDIWISPNINIDLYYDDNDLIQEYLLISDSVVIKSSNNVFVFIQKKRKHKKELIKITKTYLWRTQLK